MVAPGTWQAVWIRRVAPVGLIRRSRYELEIVLPTGKRERRVTRSPVTVIDLHLGVGDAWAVVHAADKEWNGENGSWVTVVDDPSMQRPAP